MPDFQDQVAIVTGAASGIGRATAIAFAHAGAKVMLSDVSVDAGETLAAELRAGGAQAQFHRTDVSKAHESEALVKATVARFGALHVAFNNAGIADGPPVPGTVEYPLEMWDRIIAINLSGVFYCLRAQIPAMLASGGGAIVNTSSVAGQIAFPGVPGYVASKHGVVGLTKVVALEYGARGIRCNAVGPGLVETPMISGVTEDPTARDMVLPTMVNGRFAKPEEIAAAVLWLASPAASYMNGAYVPVDGGYLAR
ncbi:MAG TPA: glucose 1-dehydrogenase [Nevskiaceae bacterium]|nr:glucose 1-dehydrogenase [Nevskiaceae bacterium]